MGLDEDDDDRTWRSPPVPTIEEALRAVAEDGTWVLFHPLTVHPEYRAVVWELVQAAAGKLPEGRRGTWEYTARDWHHQCQQGP